MNIHKNARLTPIGRERIVMQIEGGRAPRAAARAAGVCPRTARKWVARYRAEGLAGLADWSSRPRTFHRPTQLLVVDEIIALRRQRLPGKHIAMRVGVSPATLSRVLKHAGLSRMKDLEHAKRRLPRVPTFVSSAEDVSHPIVDMVVDSHIRRNTHPPRASTATSPAALPNRHSERVSPESGRVLLRHAAAKCHHFVVDYCSAAYTFDESSQRAVAAVVDSHVQHMTRHRADDPRKFTMRRTSTDPRRLQTTFRRIDLRLVDKGPKIGANSHRSYRRAIACIRMMPVSSAFRAV
jgi:transposase-like protein